MYAIAKSPYDAPNRRAYPAAPWPNDGDELAACPLAANAPANTKVAGSSASRVAILNFSRAVIGRKSFIVGYVRLFGSSHRIRPGRSGAASAGAAGASGAT